MCAVLPIQLSIFLNKWLRPLHNNLLVFDMKIHIQSVQKLGLQIAEKILGHRNVLISATVDLLRGAIRTYLFV